MKHTLPLPTQCSLVTVTIVTEGHARHTATCCCSCICLVSISLKLQCSISCNQRTHETVLVCSGVRSLGHMSVWLSGCLTSSLTSDQTNYFRDLGEIKGISCAGSWTLCRWRLSAAPTRAGRSEWSRSTQTTPRYSM